MDWESHFNDKIETLRKEIDKQESLLNEWRNKLRCTSNPRSEEKYTGEKNKTKQYIKNLENEIEDYEKRKIETTTSQKIRELEAKTAVAKYKTELVRQKAERDIQLKYAQLEYYKIKALQDIEIRELEFKQKLRFREAREILQLEILGSKIDLVGVFHDFSTWQKFKQLPKIKMPRVLLDYHGNNGILLDTFIIPMLAHKNNHYSQLKIETSLPRCPVILLLDTSDSMPENYLDKILTGLNIFKKQIQPNTTLKISNCIEVTTITFGGSAQIVQDSLKDQKFVVPELKLGGISAMGQGLDKAIEILEVHKTRYEKNSQYLTPWIFLITGSMAADNWQEGVEKIKDKIQTKQLNFLHVGVKDKKDKDFLEIIPNSFLLEEFNFNPLFYWIAHTVKGMPKKYFLSRLAEKVAIIEEDISPKKSRKIEQHMDKLITEASKWRPQRSEYENIIDKFSCDIVALEIGEFDKPIIDLIELISDTVELS